MNATVVKWVGAGAALVLVQIVGSMLWDIISGIILLGILYYVTQKKAD